MGNTVIIKVTCRSCGENFEIRVTESEYLNYMTGELVQYAFPRLTADQRELIISGTCGKCWDKMFPPEED